MFKRKIYNKMLVWKGESDGKTALLKILLFVLQLESYNLLEVCITVFINSCFLISNLFTLYRIAYNL